MSAPGRRARATGGRGAFTLIEVVGALVVFSIGVLMVTGGIGAAGTQMRYAGIVSELTVRASERLDSLDAEPFHAHVFGEDEDMLIVRGITYRRTVTLTRLSPLLAHVEIDLAPTDGTGPSHALSSYLGAAW